MSGLRLYLLGSPQIELDGQPIEIHLQKAMAILFYLVVTGQSHRRDALANFFWPDFNQRRSRSYLRNALWVLKESIGDEWLVIRREELGLRPGSPIFVDVNIFQQHIKSVRIHQILHPLQELCQICTNRLTEAVDLYRDDFLTGFTLRDSPAFDEWQYYQSEDLLQGLIGALDWLTHWHVGRGDYRTSIPFILRWIKLDPFNETARRFLMEAYSHTDQQSAALSQYQDYAQTLRQELNISPSIEMTEFYHSIKTRHDGSVATRHHEIAKHDDTILPQQPSILPDWSAGSLLEIPMAFTSLIGSPRVEPFVRREGELMKLDDLLRSAASGHGGMVFISGEPGSGKTALALEFARRALQQYPDLIVSSGTCISQVGITIPYFAFREILNLLVGEVEGKWAGGMLTAENLNRLFAFLPVVLQILVDHAPSLIGSLLPNLNISSKMWAIDSRNSDAGSLLVKVIALDFRKKSRNLDRNQVMGQYLNMLQVISTQRLLLLILDDLQWADPSTIRLLSHLSKHIGDSRILILGTFCLQDLQVEGVEQDSLISRLMSELKPLYHDQWIDLDKASRTDRSHFVNAWLDLEPNRLSKEFKQELFEITHGNPLFLTEYLQQMKDRGDLQLDEEGAWILAESYSNENLPKSVEGLIETHVNRLSKEVRLILDAASVEGFEFTIEVIADILSIDRMQLIKYLMDEQINHQLVAPLSLFRSGTQRLSWFRFRHNRFQKFLLDQLTEFERSNFHRAIGESLEQIYGEQADQIAHQLAWHFKEAGNAKKAIDYLLKAGNRAS